jgi:hypothetical protein
VALECFSRRQADFRSLFLAFSDFLEQNNSSHVWHFACSVRGRTQTFQEE